MSVIKDENILRTIVRGAYDVQKLRIQVGNRIAANFRARLGIEPGGAEDDADPKAKEILVTLRKEYHRITDGMVKFPRQSSFQGTEVIHNYTELSLIAQYMELETTEKQHFARLGNILKEYPIYTEFLVNVKGIGPAMAGVIISEFNIHKAKYASSLWAYAGLDVAKDGKGRSRSKDHLVERTYVTDKGETKTKMSITFTPFLKTKLMGVLATSFIKQKDSPYRKIYDDYKHRLENHPNHIEKSKGHRHNMALRYMVKQFLADLYEHWRTIEGLTVYKPYVEEKLGIIHGAEAKPV